MDDNFAKTWETISFAEIPLLRTVYTCIKPAQQFAYRSTMGKHYFYN
jgi:hypothetical protein